MRSKNTRRKSGKHGREPARLKQAKRFHRLVASEWARTADGKVTRERPISDGRIGIHVEADDRLRAAVEVKHSDWDRMAEHRVRPNVRRYVRQVWRYIEALLAEGKDVSPGVIFPRAPSDPTRKKQVEEWFGEEGITVVWLKERDSREQWKE